MLMYTCCGPRSVMLTGGSPRGSALVPAVVPKEFEGLELGPLLGKGSYGRVYRGVYRGEDIAVKVWAQHCPAAWLCTTPSSCTCEYANTGD